jgi:hypothetical protein
MHITERLHAIEASNDPQAMLEPGGCMMRARPRHGGHLAPFLFDAVIQHPHAITYVLLICPANDK